MSEKTEEPTPQRLRKARQDGDAPLSAVLGQSVAFLVALAVAPAALGAAAQSAVMLFRGALRDPEGARQLGSGPLAFEVVRLSVPLVGVAAFAAAAVGFVQTGGVISSKKLAPDLNRANPVNGLKNLFTLQRLVSVARALATALFVGYLATDLLRDAVPELANGVGRPEMIGVLGGELLSSLGWIAALVGLALAGVDLLTVRRAWLKRLRMSKDEIKREHKESEGDPEIKQARQRAHQEALRGSTLAAVRKATVVVVNPTHLATALSYDEEHDDAPQVVAQGRGELARQIVDAARAYGVPVVRDIPLARALGELEEGDEIPEALYEAVAEVLREVYAQAGGEDAQG